jgi:group II intron reverse transcriptase/maturase
MTTDEKKINKKEQLRNNEYYNFQEIQDSLYAQSEKGEIFNNLIPIIISRENILLAYRNIKNNKGSKTKGTNNTTIEDIKKMGEEQLISYVRDRIANYLPHSIRRKEIQKDNGKMRPLGIPTMEDRLIQQCIKQVIEPIVEAKFYKHSYGFRPNRSTEHAIARIFHLTTCNGLHYVVDIDIKAFFDNVDHGKLLKQMWSMGIQDKNLICIISKMLKAEVEGYGVQQKGVPQGGVISTVLANIVLNELDWWIYSQWEGMKTHSSYEEQGTKTRALKNKSRLKEMYIVRYCDDFKIACRNAKDAQKAFVAVKKWLQERLGLEINTEKSKIINLRKNYSDFLGFKLKVKPNKKSRVAKLSICDKAKKKIIKTIKEKIRLIKKNPTTESCNNYNATILGLQNYYRIASNCNIDFSKIAFLVRKNLYNSTISIRSKTGTKTKTYERLYGKYHLKIVYIAKVALFPIAGIVTRPSQKFHPEICAYTQTGRNKIHEKLSNWINKGIRYLLVNPVKNESLEFNDNRISLYSGQQGKCYITGEPLKLQEIKVHRKIPRNKGGRDNYSNLMLTTQQLHRLIHEEDINIVKLVIEKINLCKNGFEKLMKLRKLVGNCVI